MRWWALAGCLLAVGCGGDAFVLAEAGDGQAVTELSFDGGGTPTTMPEARPEPVEASADVLQHFDASDPVMDGASSAEASDVAAVDDGAAGDGASLSCQWTTMPLPVSMLCFSRSDCNRLCGEPPTGLQWECSVGTLHGCELLALPDAGDGSASD